MRRYSSYHSNEWSSSLAGFLFFTKSDALFRSSASKPQGYARNPLARSSTNAWLRLSTTKTQKICTQQNNKSISNFSGENKMENKNKLNDSWSTTHIDGFVYQWKNRELVNKPHHDKEVSPLACSLPTMLNFLAVPTLLMSQIYYFEQFSSYWIKIK